MGKDLATHSNKHKSKHCIDMIYWLMCKKMHYCKKLLTDTTVEFKWYKLKRYILNINSPALYAMKEHIIDMWLPWREILITRNWRVSSRQLYNIRRFNFGRYELILTMSKTLVKIARISSNLTYELTCTIYWFDKFWQGTKWCPQQKISSLRSISFTLGLWVLGDFERFYIGSPYKIM